MLSTLNTAEIKEQTKGGFRLLTSSSAANKASGYEKAVTTSEFSNSTASLIKPTIYDISTM
jgi:hypothetical protein